MCLILVAWRRHRDFPLVLAANRDEYYSRPSAVAGPWPGHPEVIGGRDLLQGGSWLAMSRQGRFAVVTNYREPPPAILPPRSRGLLVRDFLLSRQSPADYLAEIEPQGSLYSGFSLLAGDASDLGYLSNRGAGCRLLEPGLYGISNALLDSPWFKVIEGKRRLSALLASSPLDQSGIFQLLADPDPPVLPAAEMVDGDVMAGPQSPIFIRTAGYGTRCSSLLWLDRNGGLTLVERSFESGTSQWRQVRYRFDDS